MTGNETPLSGRHPYGPPFTFWPQFKIVLVGNHAPKLKGRSPAMERRLRVVPFNRLPATPDPDLKEKLRAEHSAILRWMLDGCLAWQRERLGSAAAIAAATSAYFEQQDAFRRWVDERCILDDKQTLRSRPGILLADFNAWAKENGEETASSNSFAELISRTPKLERDKVNGVRLVKGIGLKMPEPSDGRVDRVNQ
jgi:putative DNA primase/helicase